MGLISSHFESKARVKEFKGETATYERYMAEVWADKPQPADSSSSSGGVDYSETNRLVILPIVGVVGVLIIDSLVDGYVKSIDGRLVDSLIGFTFTLMFLGVFLYWIWGSDRAKQIRQEYEDGVMRAFVTLIVAGTTAYLFPYAMTSSCFDGGLNRSCLSRPSEETPPWSTGALLQIPQIRYCFAESIRIDAARGVLNKISESDVNEFNEMVRRFSVRCGEYEYKGDTRIRAKADIEPFRSVIEAEGRKLFAK